MLNGNLVRLGGRTRQSLGFSKVDQVDGWRNPQTSTFAEPCSLTKCMPINEHNGSTHVPLLLWVSRLRLGQAILEMLGMGGAALTESDSDIVGQLEDAIKKTSVADEVNSIKVDGITVTAEKGLVLNPFPGGA